MITENLIETSTEQMLNSARVEIQKLLMDMQDQARDTSILFGMLEYFIQQSVESYNTAEIRKALDHMAQDTGLEWDVIAEAVDRMGVCDSHLCKHEYIVTMEIPVTISMTVVATDEDQAQTEALDLAECNGIEYYDMDWESYRVEYHVEEY